jgi:hypothetical protein
MPYSAEPLTNAAKDLLDELTPAFEVEETIHFHSDALDRNLNRHEWAARFYNLMVLLDADVLVGEQDAPYAEIVLSQGGRFSESHALFPEVPGVYAVPE